MTEAKHFYQAIGELQATLVVAQDGTKFLETAEGQHKIPNSAPSTIATPAHKLSASTNYPLNKGIASGIRLV
ncbi:MAG: hypothetical protein JOZ78_25120 [Chroococcidiopsidaceae cyanobacterium CP_BM_ER_R8_30]|nr:hypothetical protein [Chroococcidiopsidaceae cyanobacterium CP_BM_ER_R8_30]